MQLLSYMVHLPSFYMIPFENSEKCHQKMYDGPIFIYKLTVVCIFL